MTRYDYTELDRFLGNSVTIEDLKGDIEEVMYLLACGHANEEHMTFKNCMFTLHYIYTLLSTIKRKEVSHE